MSGVVFGQSVARLEDPPLLRGRARFVDDIVRPGMLHACFVRSPHAHAAVRSIEAAAARDVAGVVAVLTLADLAPHLTTTVMNTALPSPSFQLELHRPVLAAEEVVHVGEAVAVVIAESRYVAEDAAALVDVDYDPLPVVADAMEALEPGSSPAHSSASHNIAARFRMGFGDTAAAFASAHRVVTANLLQHRGVAHSMECRGCIAEYDRDDDRLTLWNSTQTPHAGKRMLCELLGRDEEQVRVVCPDVGGGFGPKLVIYPEEVAVSVAALALGRPVKWIEDRREHFVATTQERDQHWDMELAVDVNGSIVGVRGRLVHDHGAYSARGVNVPYGSAAALTLPYLVPTYDLDVILVATNKVAVTPIRGAGQPQAVFAMERLLDQAARELGLDRAEIRRRNLVPPARIPYKTPLKTRGGMQVVLDSGDYPACQAAALERAGWSTFAERQAAARVAGRLIGIGLANYVEGTGRGPFEPVSVRIAENGRIHVASGAAPMGQSTKTMLAQVVAEQLGGDMANVTVVAGDTAAIDLGLGGFNSRQAVMAGSSAHAAALKVKAKVLKVAAHMLDVGEQALELSGRDVRVKGDGGKSLALSEIARAVAGLPGYYIPGDVEPGLHATEHVIINDMTYANGTAVAEVEVDAETGMVAVTRVVFAHDCGQMINPKIVDGQIIGGIAHGIGNALFEWMGFDSNAQPVTTTLADYLLVTSTEMPTRIELIHQSTKTPLNPLGVKGVGESGVIPMPAAIASAVENALEHVGVRIRAVPIKPPALLELIEAGAARR